MKGLPFIKRLSRLVVCLLALTGSLHAQQYSILHRFNDGSVTNDGQHANSILQAFDGNFYGVTSAGGSSAGDGAVFKMTPQGITSVFYAFTAAGGVSSPTNLIQAADGSFYGTTNSQVFHLTQTGQLTVLYTVPSDGGGAITVSGIMQAGDGNLYGTTHYNAAGGDGLLFKITPQGVFSVLHTFGDGSVTNDGAQPYGNLVQGADGNFYGTTYEGGTANRGTVFMITPQGTVTILHNFYDGSVSNDGYYPHAGLILGSDGNFYGTTAGGGTAGHGTAFKITPAGTVTILHNFNAGSTVNDGSGLEAPLIQGYDGNFYGSTVQGGSSAEGTIFQMTPQGVVTTLHSFGDGTVTNDGTNSTPSLTPLVQTSAGNFYGVTNYGGVGVGTVYSFTPSAIAVISATSASGSVSVPFSYQTTATNHPTSYSATNLPSGLSIDSSTGIISGTPTTVETNSVTLTATNSTGSGSSQLTIAIGAFPPPTITSLLTAYGSVGAAFTYNIIATDSPTAYSADAASLTTLANAGLSLNNSTGVISGTPVATGTLSVNLTASNTAGTGTTAALSIQISAAATTLNQEYNVLHRFNDGSVTNDGQHANSILQAFDGNFYGVTSAGGSSAGDGAVFKMTPQGITSVFYAFTAAGGVSSPTNLIQAADGSFYGTTSSQIFHLTQTGQLTVLYAYPSDAGGAITVSGIMQAGDGNFYGTTHYTAAGGDGLLFKITPQGVFSVLHTFGDGSVTNDGAQPYGNLVQGADGNFYGTTYEGGTKNQGSVFKATPQGTVTILHNFADGSVANDGYYPLTGLVLASDGNFYGVTHNGGTTGGGTAFKITPQGTVTILHNFNDGSTVNDGSNPLAPLVQGYDGNFYGTTSAKGSSSGQGTIFQMSTQGAVTTLHSFGDGTVTNDGNNSDTPAITPLVQSSAGNFYGVTNYGGVGVGTVFSIQAMQTPTHVPIYFGAAYQEASVLAPFSFTPKALFGVSGSGNVQTNAVKAPGSDGMMDALVSVFLPQSIRKNYALTSWSLFETGVGSIPPNTLQPLNLMFDPTSGTISGTPVQSGTYSLSLTPSNVIGSGAAQPVTIYIDVPPALSGAATASATVGTPFSYQVATTLPALSYNATNLPSWLTFDPATNMVSGTPTTVGTYVFTTSAQNSAGTTTQAVVLTVTGGSSSVPTITSSTVATGAVGTPFTYPITTAHAATAFSALVPPCGLAFDAGSATIRGTPNTTGFFQIPISATNASGTYASVLSLTVTPPTAPTIASALNVLAAKNVAFYYAIPATGVVSTFAETGTLPDGLTFNAATGTITGTPTANGNSSVSLTVTNSTGSASATLNLSVQSPITFGSWTTTYGVTGGALGTPYHDGVPNLLKFFCDIAATAPIADADRGGLPIAGTAGSDGSGVQTLTFRQSALASGLNVNIQTSPDMHSWTTVATEPSSSIVPIGNDPTTGDPVYQAQVPFTSTPQFIRLQLSQP